MPLVVVTGGAAGGQWVDPSAIADCAPEGVDTSQIADATADLLFALSGYRYGEVTQTVRPYRTGEVCGCAGAADEYSFSWTSHSAWGRAASCACGGPSYLRLLAPVSDVAEVVVDGEALDVDDWTLWDGQWLVRNGARWPCCQNLEVPSSEVGTWAVTYTHGIPVPAAGQLAAKLLACELAKAAGGEDCQLSGRVQTVTRDGVSAVIVEAGDFLAERRTGITVVDLWLASLPPSGGGTITRGGFGGLLRAGS